MKEVKKKTGRKTLVMQLRLEFTAVQSYPCKQGKYMICVCIVCLAG